ncbi:MAG: DnaJ domain-containing protein [Bacteroidales bacterium]|nr:DnaJ domain-containing protein [Bacteroidales bacterium]
MKDYYKILGLTRDSSTETIKQKFKELAFEYHPDVSDNRDAGEIFIEIYEAYHILSNPEKKKSYDLLHDKYINNIRTYIPEEESVRDDINNLSDRARTTARQKAQVRYNDFLRDLDCFFTEGQKADGVPYSYNMHKNIGISGGIGPMGSIKSKFFHARKYFLAEKYRAKGYKRGFHPMVSTTPVGIISYFLRLIF